MSVAIEIGESVALSRVSNSIGLMNPGGWAQAHESADSTESVEFVELSNHMAKIS